MFVAPLRVSAAACARGVHDARGVRGVL